MSEIDSNGNKVGDLAVQDVTPKLKKPPLYKVVLLNDDFTPMDFVVDILVHFFSMSEENATLSSDYYRQRDPN